MIYHDIILRFVRKKEKEPCHFFCFTLRLFIIPFVNNSAWVSMPRGDRDFYDRPRGGTDVLHEESFYSAVCSVFSRDRDIHSKYSARNSTNYTGHLSPAEIIRIRVPNSY